MAGLAICYTESVIYIISLDVIRETTATTAKFNGIVLLALLLLYIVVIYV